MPKAVAFPEDIEQVSIVVEGQRRIISPADNTWDAWFDGPDVTPDFMDEREQPPEQKRESF